MAIFAIYQFKLEKFKNLQLQAKFPEEDGKKKNDKKYKTLEEFFESFFPKRGGKLNISELKERTKGGVTAVDADPHGNEVEQHRKRVVVFRLQANKTKRIDNADWTHEKHPHHPDCRVIIDFREESCLMAIEKKTTAFDPDKACDLLQKSFNRMMHDYGVRIGFERLEKQALFWDAVNEIRLKFNDAVQRVQFDFNGEEHNTDDASFADRLTEWVGLFGRHAQLAVDIENDLRLKEVENDLTRMAELCYQNRNYNLTVKFRDFGLFRYGQDIKAQLGLDDEVVDAFVARARQLRTDEPADKADQDMLGWFDRIKVLFDEYGKNSSVKSKGTTGNRL